MISNVIVPIDGSESSRSALAFAAYLARLAPARLHLLHVTLPTPAELMRSMGYPAVTLRQAEASAAAFEQGRAEGARKILADARSQVPRGADVEEAIGSGDPARFILEYAARQTAPAIVMGSHGHSEAEELLLGSVSSKVLHQAHCPVTILR
jgi:nucleotide-binding universal stress UspA family protein